MNAMYIVSTGNDRMDNPEGSDTLTGLVFADESQADSYAPSLFGASITVVVEEDTRPE